MVDEAGRPYAVPVSFAVLSDRLCFHGGQGRKSAALAAHPEACLVAVTPPDFLRGGGPCADNFRYRSVLVEGRVDLLTDPEERVAALRAIVAKYDPAAAEEEFAPATLERTRVYALSMERLSTKEHEG
jgi:nitroimidazol reductase NimA-like FMN-containing flavoprotein (pyridoxamine 5'-phosphate oxidase superfamily)